MALAWKDHLDYIGYITAVMGGSQVLSSIVTRIISGRYEACRTRRGNRRLMCSGSLVGSIAVVLSLYAIWHSQLSVLMAAMSLWGILWGISESLLPKIFGEAVSYLVTGQRSVQMCSHLIRLGNVVGMSVTLVTFLLLGNKWTIENCAFVMTVGLLSSIPVLFLLCSLRVVMGDDELDDEEGITGTNIDRDDDCEDFERHAEYLLSIEETEEGNIDLLALNVSYGQYSPGASQDEFDVDPSPENDHTRIPPQDTSESVECFSDAIRVLCLVVLTDTLSSFAAGLSVRYFPVFFAKHLALDPVSVQILFLVVPLGQWLFLGIANSLGRVFGPCRTIVTLHCGYVSCMLSMIVCQRRGMPLGVVSAFFVLQASLMNSTSSLSKAVILRNVPESDLPNWTMTETLSMALFSIGAATGGTIVGRWGMLTNFTVTAFLQLSASIPLIFLYCVDPEVDARKQPTWLTSGYAEQDSTSTDPFESCCESDSGILMFEDCVSGEASSKTTMSLQSIDILDRQDSICPIAPN